MRKYFTAFIAFALLAVVLTVICLVSFKPIDALMKPPMTGGENHKIQVAFEEYLDESYKLRVPLSGAYRSSYISEDLNNDGQEEIVVLYSTEDEVDIVKIIFMMKIKNKWTVVSNLESNYSEVHQVKFADINGDGIMEMLVGWTVFHNDLSRHLSVYNLPIEGNGDLNSLYSTPYLMFDTVDIDSDGMSDIAIFESSDDGVNLSCNMFYNGVINKKAVIALDASVYSVSTLSYDNSDKKNGLRIFVDSYKIDSGMLTECICWDNDEGQFKKIKSEGVSVLSSRLTGITCQDIDGDGSIEIPVEVPLEDSILLTGADTSVSGTQNLIKWIKLEDNGYTTVTHQLIYNNNDFGVTFNDKWLKYVTVRNNYSDNSIRFYSTKDKEKTLLFELKYTSTQLEEDALSNKFKFLTETNKGKLFYTIYNADIDLSINKIFLENSIVLYGG